MDGVADTGTRPAQTTAETYVIRSYRYLRLAIVILLAGLAVAVLAQRSDVGCIEDSISAFYYTPVHGLFIGSLVATGAAMVALNGRTLVENGFFNIAGLLAPMVALVPTTSPSPFLCDDKTLPLNLDRNDLVPNSLAAVVGAGIVALGVMAIVAATNSNLKERARSFRRSLRTAAVPAAIFAIAAVLFVSVWDVPWYTFLHYGSAGGAFAAIFLAIGSLLSKRLHFVLHFALDWRKPPDDEYRKPKRGYLRAYWSIIGATLPIAAITALPSDAPLFWVEVTLLASFTGFWIVQSAELWTELPAPSPAMKPVPGVEVQPDDEAPLIVEP